MFFLFVIQTTCAHIVISDRYQSKGLQEIEFDVHHIMSTARNKELSISITLQSLDNKRAYLTACNNPQREDLTQIFTNTQSLKSYISLSNNSNCVFDTFNALFDESIQSIQLSKGSSSILSYYSQYPLSSPSFKLYVYSETYTEYQIQIESKLNSCQKYEFSIIINSECNKNGICVLKNALSPTCLCDKNHFGSLCNIAAFELDTRYRIDVTYRFQYYFQMILSQSQNKLFFIDLNKYSNTDLEVIIDSNADFRYQQGCYLQNYEIYPNSNYLSNNEQLGTDTYSYGIDTTTLKQCIEFGKQLSDQVGQIVDSRYLILLENDSNFVINTTIRLSLQKDEENGNQLLYILVGFFSSSFLLIICILSAYRYSRKKAKERQLQPNEQQPTTTKKNQLNYEQIIRMYPGLCEVSECQICLDRFTIQQTISFTKCLHLFHERCLMLWMKKNKTCPSCRDQLSQSTLNLIPLLEQKTLEQYLDRADSEEYCRIRDQRLQQLKQPTVTSLLSTNQGQTQERVYKPDLCVHSLNYIEDNI